MSFFPLPEAAEKLVKKGTLQKTGSICQLTAGNTQQQDPDPVFPARKKTAARKTLRIFRAADRLQDAAA